MECRIAEEVPDVAVEFLSYIDNFLCGLHDERQVLGGLNEVERRELMEELLDRVSVVLQKWQGSRTFLWLKTRRNAWLCVVRLGGGGDVRWEKR